MEREIDMKYGDIVVYNNEIGKVVRDNETDTFRFLPCGHGSCYFSTLDIISEENTTSTVTIKYNSPKALKCIHNGIINVLAKKLNY